MEPGIIIWDMDGVLIDVGDSYRKTIIETVQNYFSNFLGIELKDYLMGIKDTQKFKLASGFNDDWELTYAAVLCYLTEYISRIDINKKELDKWNPNGKTGNLDQMILMLHDLGKFYRGDNLKINLREITKGIKSLGGGLSGTEEALKRIYGNNLEIAKKFWFKKLIKRNFEEIYLGRDLFEKKYGEPARFIDTEGLINNEKPLVDIGTLLEIRRRYYFGIVTGRERFEAEFSLKKQGIYRLFDKTTIICSDDVKEKKPNPTPLLECRNRILRRFGLGKSTPVIYVGDSIDDLNAARNANFYFAAVLGGIHDIEERNELREIFHGMHSDIIVDDILELTIYI